MNWTDPHKFDMMPDEPDDAEYWRLNNQYLGEWGAFNCYDGTAPKLTQEQKDRLKQYWNPERDYDDLDVKLGLVSQSKVDALLGFIDETPPMHDVEGMDLTWMWKPVSNANSQNGRRDMMRTGKLYTRTKNYMLVGFETYQEFNDHLHISDKEGTREVNEALHIYYNGRSQTIGEYKMCYWVAKEMGEMRTIPGFWAISIDELFKETRDVYYWANQQGGDKKGLAMNKKNTIGVKR